ncbi:TPA: hypothetical protein L9M63_005371 [Klebsiella pneumoniae]|nr:hypothetical protein [Klebsiella pneumoniae]
MEQKQELITCPFCHNDRIVKGMRVCTQCHALIGYGIVPVWAFSLVAVVASLAGIAVFAVSNANIVATFSVFLPILFGGGLTLKGIYADRVVFQRR